MKEAVYRVLTKPKRIRAQITKSEAEMQGLRLSMLPGAIRYDKDKIQTSPDDPMTKYAARMDDLTRKITELKNEYMDAQDEVVDLANTLDDPQSVIITLRFISGCDFSEIAKSLHMSERQMFRYYKQATDELGKRCH